MTAYLYKFKLLNGPLAGRELGLPEGELRLGGEDPDLAVPLEEAASATLSVSQEGIRLVTSTPVWVDGSPWDTETVLPLGQVVDLAGQALIFGETEADLPSQPIPPRVSPQTTTKNSWLIVCMIIVMLCGVGLTVMVWQLGSPTLPFNTEKWLSTQLRDPALKGIQVHKNSAGTLILSGHCVASSQLDILRTALREQGLLVRNEAVCQDTLQRNVRYVLELNGYRDFQVLPGKKLGSVEIHGAIQADNQWQQAAKQLNALTGLDDWTVINNDNAIFHLLLDTLRAKSLLDGLSITLSNGNLLVTGQLDATQATAIEGVLASFNQSAPSRLKASFQNIPAAIASNKLLPATIVSLGGNAHALYVELANGMRLQQGSVLPTGYTIYSLNQKGLALLKDQMLIYLPLNL